MAVLREPGAKAPAAEPPRLLATVSLLLYGARLLIFGSRDKRASAVELRERIERLGGAWIKLGQNVSVRTDILDEVYCAELSRLLDAVGSIDFPAAAAVIEAELGAPPDRLFTSFEPEPIAAASIGQVHLATLGSAPVAVKVQRPGIVARFEADLRVMRAAAAIGDLLRLGRGLRLRDLILEFTRWTRIELDYREEAFSGRLLCANAGSDPIESHSRTYPELSSRRVLTMEFARGLPLNHLLRARWEDDRAFLDAFHAAGHDEERIASHILWNTLNQIYRFGLFHADPHPANLFVGKGDAISYVDSGLVGRLGDSNRRLLLRFGATLIGGDAQEATRLILRLARPTVRTDVAAAEGAMETMLQRYVETMTYGTPADRIEALSFDLAIMKVARTHRLAVNTELALFLKTISTVDAVVNQLVPGFNTLALQRRFFQRLVRLEICDVLRPGRLYLNSRNFGEAVLEGLERDRRRDEAPAEGAARMRAVGNRVRRLQAVTLFGAAGALSLLLAMLLGAGTLLGVPAALLAFLFLAVAALSAAGAALEVSRLDRLCSERLL